MSHTYMVSVRVYIMVSMVVRTASSRPPCRVVRIRPSGVLVRVLVRIGIGRWTSRSLLW